MQASSGAQRHTGYLLSLSFEKLFTQGWSLGVQRSLLPIVQVAIIKRHLALLAFLVKDHRVKAEKPVTEGRGGFGYGLRAA